MHACFICEEYPPAPHGGTGSSCRDLAEGLVAAGHRATVVGINTTQPLPRIATEERAGVRVVRLPRAPRWLGTRLGGWRERRSLRAALAREHRPAPFDFVEASDYHGWLSQGGLPGIPTIVRIRGSNLFFDSELKRPPSLFEHRHERATIARADHLAAVSRYAADRTLALSGVTNRECTIIPNGVDADVFCPSPDVTPEPGLIVFVNSLNPKKGIEQLLDAASSIFPSQPRARLVVIGEDTQAKQAGGYLAALRERVPPALRARVEFTGRLPREQVVGWLRRAAVCCYPSHMETFGIAALEAMAVGRPTIFTKAGPGPEVVEDGLSGLLCDPRSPSSIATALTRLLDDPPFAETLGANARQRVLALFNARDWVRRNVDFFSRCLGRI